jgi:hypothetical protein
MYSPEIAKSPGRRRTSSKSRADACWKRFKQFFPLGFDDPKYISWERGYKWAAHTEWQATLNRNKYRALLGDGRFQEISAMALRIESRTNLLFSFEKMALRDGVRSSEGAEKFAVGLFELLHGRGSLTKRFDGWCDAVSSLPRKQTRVVTHPVVTVFPFIADPKHHIFLKPKVVKAAASAFGFELDYSSRPSWYVYAQLLQFGELIRKALKPQHPHDMIDIQSFMWVIGSDEYEHMMTWKQRPLIT